MIVWSFSCNEWFSVVSPLLDVPEFYVNCLGKKYEPIMGVHMQPNICSAFLPSGMSVSSRANELQMP